MVATVLNSPTYTTVKSFQKITRYIADKLNEEDRVRQAQKEKVDRFWASFLKSPTELYQDVDKDSSKKNNLAISEIESQHQAPCLSQSTSLKTVYYDTTEVVEQIALQDIRSTPITRNTTPTNNQVILISMLQESAYQEAPIAQGPPTESVSHISEHSNTAIQALQLAQTLRDELNNQLPNEIGKMYAAQEKMEEQVSSLSTSLQQVVGQLQEVAKAVQGKTRSKLHKINEEDKVLSEAVTTISSKNLSRFRSHDDSSDSSSDESSSSSDDHISDHGSDHTSVSSEEDVVDNDGGQESHSLINNKFKFKVPEEKYSGNPHKIESWLFNLEEYFENAKVKKHLQVPIATSNMISDATLWWRMLRKANQAPKSWTKFKKAIRERFLPLNIYKANRSRLETLRQTGSVTKYNSIFQAAIVECSDVSEAEALSRYIYGLKSQTKKYVELQEPRVLRKAMKLAENYDNASFSIQGSHGHKSGSGGYHSGKKKHHHSRNFRDKTRSYRDDPMDLDQVEKTHMKLTWEQARKEGRCQICGMKDHIKKDCPSRKESKN